MNKHAVIMIQATSQVKNDKRCSIHIVSRISLYTNTGKLVKYFVNKAF